MAHLTFTAMMILRSQCSKVSSWHFKNRESKITLKVHWPIPLLNGCLTIIQKIILIILFKEIIGNYLAEILQMLLSKSSINTEKKQNSNPLPVNPFKC